MFDKGVGLNLRNESQRRVQNELIDADGMSVIGRMACSISHDMRHSLSAIYANAEFLERHDLCASERVGQFSHVALYDHGKSQVFGMSDGVPPGAVCTIYHDRAGNVWAGGRGGQSKFENGRFRPLSKSNGLPAQSVFGMVEDDEGYWWLGHRGWSAENSCRRTRSSCSEPRLSHSVMNPSTQLTVRLEARKTLSRGG
jgi:ligand-binding sensor domain-containing protein